jgi:hypothetical protein
LFQRLDELATKSRAKLTEAYSNYVRALQACLVAVSGPDPRVTIEFYGGLSDQLRDVVLEAAETSDVDIGVVSRARSPALKGIDDVLLKFQRYCTDVEMAYLQLRKDSLV